MNQVVETGDMLLCIKEYDTDNWIPFKKGEYHLVNFTEEIDGVNKIDIYSYDSTKEIEMAGPDDMITVNSVSFFDKESDLHLYLSDYFETKIDRAKKIIKQYNEKGG